MTMFEDEHILEMLQGMETGSTIEIAATMQVVRTGKESYAIWDEGFRHDFPTPDATVEFIMDTAPEEEQ